MQVTTIGLDLAKRVFQVHGVDATGKIARGIIRSGGGTISVRNVPEGGAVLTIVLAAEGSGEPGIVPGGETGADALTRHPG